MKEETFIITIVSSPLIRPPDWLRCRLLKCPVFSTHLKSPHTLLTASRLSSNLSLANPSLLPHNSPICSSPVSASPLNGLTLRLGGRRGERETGGREEEEWRASGYKGECTWMGRLPGHAVRGYCPACQQPLSFNGAHISSF